MQGALILDKQDILKALVLTYGYNFPEYNKIDVELGFRNGTVYAYLSGKDAIKDKHE
jgi:glutathione peroxidase-family protein